VSSIIISFKDRGRTAIAGFLARRMLVLLERFAPAPFQLVPVPTRRSSIAKRGFDHTKFLTKEIGRQSGHPVLVGALSLRRDTSDQRELGVAERRGNLYQSMECNPWVSNSSSGSNLRSLPVVLVDDVVTTGASMLEAKRALQSAGFEVLGFITIAETVAKNQRNLENR